MEIGEMSKTAKARKTEGLLQKLLNIRSLCKKAEVKS